MKNGYYLSAYISIDKIGNLYNLLSNRHDMAVALWEKEDEQVKLKRYWELERLSKIKHHGTPFYDKEKAIEVISDLLKQENLNLQDINEIWGCPKLKNENNLNEEGYYFHSISHLFSSLMLDTDIFYNENILGLALDLRSDNETEIRQPDGFDEYVGCYSQKGKVKYFNISSPAILWCICKNELHMQEGSLMALATATNCTLKHPVEVDLPLSFYWPDYTKGYDIYNKIFENLTLEKVDNIDPDFSEKENLISAGMKEINRITYLMMENSIENLIKEYSINPKETYLAISGGFGLNCPTNSHLLTKYGFKGFLGAPCMDDSGQALGIGLYNFYKKMNNFKFKLSHAFYGKEFEFDDKFFTDLKEKGYINSITELNEDTFVSDLLKDIVVWYESGAEIGPRALGHRSLLGDPRKLETKDRLNQVKQRQFWRPVAPIVLRECVKDWFEDDFDSPYMLHTSKVKIDKKDLVPAILHYDDTARLQTICNIKETSCLYNLIKHFYKYTSVPIICNTSLNDKGEPIINSPQDAIRFATNKKITVLYINKKRVELNLDNKNLKPLEPFVEFTPILNKEQFNKALLEVNPYNLDKNILIWRDIFHYDIKNKEGAEALKKSVEFVYRTNPGMKRMFDFF